MGVIPRLIYWNEVLQYLGLRGNSLTGTLSADMCQLAGLWYLLIGVGLSFWTLAAAGCGVSVDFWSITICRMLVGVGEASFISLVASFIDDNAPVELLPFILQFAGMPKLALYQTGKHMMNHYLLINSSNLQRKKTTQK